MNTEKLIEHQKKLMSIESHNISEEVACLLNISMTPSYHCRFNSPNERGESKTAYKTTELVTNVT